MYQGICEAIHKELEQLDEKYSKGTQMSGSDLDAINKMAHALKSLKTYEAMEGNGEYDYARGRSRMTGRYMSRDDGYESRDYRRY